jgi:threonine dehydratase
MCVCVCVCVTIFYYGIGQGTVAVELLEQVPNLDAILVPTGGGGLISGIAVYAKQMNPKIRIFACVPEGKMLEECLTSNQRLWPEPAEFLATKCEGMSMLD